jgi:hypothetical protein
MIRRQPPPPATSDPVTTDGRGLVIGHARPLVPDLATESGQTGDYRLGYWLILALAAGLRLPLLLVTQGFDYWFYQGLGRLSELGFLPYRDYWVEYPPVFPWLAVVAYRFTLLFPPTLFKDLDASYHLVLGSLLVLADLAIVALLGAIGQHLWPRPEVERRMLFYAILFWPIVVAIGWYDSLPCAMLLLGLWLILRGQGGAAGAVAGLGFMTKVFPLILVPIAVKFLPRWRDRLAAIIGAALVTAVIAVPLLALGPTYFLASYRAVFNRSAWETIWAIADGYYSYGKVAPLGVRFDPSTADYVAFRAHIPTFALTIVFAVLYAGFWLRPVARTARNVVLATAISIVGFLLYSKGYSPQFIIYALPFVIVLLPWRRAVGYSLALSAFNLLEWPLYHEWFGQVPWLLGIAVAGRTALFLALCWEWLAELWGLRNPLLTLRLDRRLVLAGGTALVIVAIPLSVLAWRTWTAGYYDGSPLKPAYDFVARHDPAPAGRAAYVFADQDLYESFYPFFARTADFYLLRPDNAGDDTIKHPSLTPEGRQAELATIASEHRQIFLIRNADDWTSRDLNAWLTEHTQLTASARAGNTDLSLWTVALPGPKAATP